MSLATSVMSRFRLPAACDGHARVFDRPTGVTDTPMRRIRDADSSSVAGAAVAGEREQTRVGFEGSRRDHQTVHADANGIVRFRRLERHLLEARVGEPLTD